MIIPKFMQFSSLEDAKTPLGFAKIVRVIAILFFVIPFFMLFLP